MKIAFNFVLLATLVFYLPACSWFTQGEDERSEIEKLPAATSSGKHTFGCLVNDKAFIPYTEGHIAAVFQGGILQISGKVDAPTKPDIPQWISLVLIEQGTEILEPRTYDLTSPPNRKASCSINDCSYYEEHISSGSITITNLDRVNFIVSGYFEFTAEGNGCEKITVTNGRFDIKYVP